MPKRDIRIGQEWLQQNLRHPRVDDVRDWLNMMTNISSANLASYEFTDWLEGRTRHTPDMVGWVSLYGRIRLKLEGWTLPIDLSEAEATRWREGGYMLTLEDFQEGLAGVAGGFLEQTGRQPRNSADLIQSQLDEDLATLERVVNLPLDPDYTPKYMEWQVRERLIAQGVPPGPDLDDAVFEIMIEEYHPNEISRMSWPFTLRDRLEGFEWGFEKLRMYAITEHSPEVYLPNRPLFDALSRIDLTMLTARLERTDEPLRRILEHLDRYKCREMENAFAPKSFWWRHYWANKEQKKTRRKRG